jgi:hypothetical protein
MYEDESQGLRNSVLIHMNHLQTQCFLMYFELDVVYQNPLTISLKY